MSIRAFPSLKVCIPKKPKPFRVLRFQFHPLILTRFLEFQFSKYSKVSPLAFQSLRVEPKKYFKSADDSQNEVKPKSWNTLSISDLVNLQVFLDYQPMT